MLKLKADGDITLHLYKKTVNLICLLVHFYNLNVIILILESILPQTFQLADLKKIERAVGDFEITPPWCN